MAEVCRAADGLIDPSQIPGLSIQPGVIGSAASAFTGAAGLVRERGAAVVTSWSTLSTVYSAPEAEQLLNVMSPVGSDTAVLSDQVSSIGSELAVLAETVEPIQQSLIGIRDRADVFVAKAVQGTTVDYWDPNHPAWDDGWFVGFMLKDFDEMVPAHIPWDKYQPWIDENNALIAEVNAQVALLDEARVACVNAINRLRADVCVAPEQAITVEQLNAEGVELTWGTQGNGDRSCYESVNDGISESFTESVAGLGSLVSRNPETGEWGDWASAGANWVQLGATLGAIVLVGPVMPLLANTAPKGSWGQEFAQGVVDRQVAVVEGLVGSPEEWQENPAKAAGSVGFNVGTFFIPGAGAVGGAAKAGLLGARAASLLERATLVLGAGGKVVSEAAGAAVSKVGALLSDTLNVLKSGGHLAKAELDALFTKLEGAIDNVKTHFTQPEHASGGSPVITVGDDVSPAGAHGASTANGADGSSIGGHGVEDPGSVAVDGGTVPTGPVDSHASRGDGWTRTDAAAEGLRNPESGDGQVFANHGDSGAYPTRPPKIIDETTGELMQNPATARNDRTWDLVADEAAPYGHRADGTPMSKLEYDERFVQGNPDNWDRYPSYAGVEPGTRVRYSDPVAYINEYGIQFDRIGEPGNGEYLGVFETGKPASFEARGLPISSLNKNYYEYSFAPDAAVRMQTDGIQIEISRIAPAFGRDGGGLQMRLIKVLPDGDPVILKVGHLLREGYLIS